MSTQSKDEIVIIPDAEKNFKDEWVAFEVYEVDERNKAYKGRLIVHSPKRGEVWAKVKELNPHDCYISFAGEKPKKGKQYIL
jgi:hypothetical protein